MHLLGGDALAAGLGLDRRNDHVRLMEERHPVTDREEAGRMVDAAAEHAGDRRELGLAGEVELQEVDTSLRGLDPEPRGLSLELRPHHRPRELTVRRRRVARAPDQLLGRELTHREPVLEPARVRHLVQRVHVHRLAGLLELERVTDGTEERLLRTGRGER